jgi:hypothetical protein
MATIEAPVDHYYVKPYSLLGFLFGLYCDEDWSEEEYIRWEASESPRHSGSYSYAGYLTPYEPIPATSREIINIQLKANPLAPNGRRNPTSAQFEAFWPDFREELMRPNAGEQAAGFKRVYFVASRPILSALACIYLGNAASVGEIVGMAGQNGSRAQLPAVFGDLIALRRSGGDLQNLLDSSLKPLLLQDLQTQPAAW